MNKTLKLTYSTTIERRVSIDRAGGLQHAISDILTNSGLLHGGAQGVDPASIHFEIEDD